jgi:hypothetical protein
LSLLTFLESHFVEMVIFTGFEKLTQTHSFVQNSIALSAICFQLCFGRFLFEILVGDKRVQLNTFQSSVVIFVPLCISAKYFQDKCFKVKSATSFQSDNFFKLILSEVLISFFEISETV